MIQRDSYREIVDYYDTCYLHYRLVWFNGSTMAMHHGYWDADTKTHAEALLNTNRVPATKIGVKPGQTILDAGCGVGGSAIWLAKTYGAKVIGITLSRDQARRARQFAHKQGVAHLVEFNCQDYNQTGFPDGTFDAVWAIESVCHTRDKKRFVNEAARVLKVGGKLVVADMWASHQSYSGVNRQLMESWLSPWAMPIEHFMTPATFFFLLGEAGFINVEFTDHTHRILRSSRRLHTFSLFSYPVTSLLQVLRLQSEIEMGNVRAARNQYQALLKGLWRHGVVYGEKR